MRACTFEFAQRAATAFSFLLAGFAFTETWPYMHCQRLVLYNARQL